MTTETRHYNPFDHLLAETDLGDYLSQAFMDEDPAVFITALGHVARKRGLTQLALDTGLSRESLYKTLSGKTKPRWDTVQRLIKALHMTVRVAAWGE